MSSPDPPEYTKYRARPRLFGRGGDGGVPGRPPRAGDGPREPRSPGAGERKDFRAGRRGSSDGVLRGSRGGRGRLSARRVAKWLVFAVIGWIALSAVVFFVSATLSSLTADGDTKDALAGGGAPPFSETTILVLGSDQRTEGLAEPGARTSGPSRSDSIMLLRVGGGANSRLSVARDTIVPIPGHDTQKVNAAYALGGAPLAVRTLEGYLDLEIDHVMEISFDRFPDLIDAMGGITYRGGCVVSKINGGFANGGYTLRLRGGKERIDGDQALALARTRKNLCNPDEDDRTRAARQQKVLAAMRSKLTTPLGLFGIPHGSFYRLPLVAWQAPRTLGSDMGGLTMAGVFAGLAVGGGTRTEVLGTADGNVPEARRRAAVQRFLRG